MIRLNRYLALAFLALPLGLCAQDAVTPESSKPVMPPVTAEAQAKTPDESAIDKLIGALGGDDLDAREEAMEKLKSMGKKARAKIELAAKESEHKEVRWNARQLLKQMKNTPRTAARSRALPTEPTPPSVRDDIVNGLAGRLDALRERHESLMRQMQELQARFSDGNFEEVLKNLGGGEVNLDDLVSRAKEGISGLRGGLSSGGHMLGESFSVDSNDGHIRFTVRKNVDGESVEETYEADSAEEFAEKHADVVEKYGIKFMPNGGINVRRGGRSAAGGSGGLHGAGQPDALPSAPTEETELSPTTPVPAAAPGERLGVRIDDVDADTAAALGLGEGEGMKVMDVEKDSLAESAGVKAGDVVISVAGKKALDPESVRAALKSVKAGAEFTVVVGREGERVELKTQMPAPADKPKGAKNLEKF